MILIIAMLFMLLGHLLKWLRWELLIAVYEKPNHARLIQAMAMGQVMNVAVPFHLGYAFKVFWAGRTMKNGYPLAASTVIADVYLDTLTVGVVFAVLSALQIHVDEIRTSVWIYGMAALLLVGVTIAAVLFKTIIKKLVKMAAGIFNAEIELGILYTTYCFFENMKNIYREINPLRVAVFTVGTWGAYFLSYNAFAQYMQSLGYACTLTAVFNCIFSFQNSADYLLYMLVPALALLGLSWILSQRNQSDREKTRYRYVLPQLNPNEKLSFLEMYFQENEKRDYIQLYLNINKDVNVIRDYSAGSNATTILCMNEHGTFFRKYALGQDAKKLQEQIDWLDEFCPILPLPQILKRDFEQMYCCYDMAYNPQAVSFFHYIHSMPVSESWNVLRSVLNCLEQSIYEKRRRAADRETIARYIQNKVIKNIGLCKNGGKYLRALWDYDTIYVNGTAYPNLKTYWKLLGMRYLMEVFAKDCYAVIHGDLTVENIVCISGGGENGWYLIDPNTANLHESPFLDYAKLLQSLHGGYEFLMTVKEVEIHENNITFLFTRSSAYKELYEHFKQYLFRTFSREEVRSIYVHEIVHYLRLMPYKIQKDAKRAVVFYVGMLIVIDDVCKMFGVNSSLEEQAG